jgi:hypothetical protein
LADTKSALKDAWKQVVPKDVAAIFAISSTTDFFRVSGISLVVFKLQTVLREKFNAVLSMIGLFKAGSLASVPPEILNARSLHKTDWKAEITLSKIWFQVLRLRQSCLPTPAPI